MTLENIAQNAVVLDERGFVFLDGGGRPYRVCIWGDKPWLFYWHKSNRWVSYREVSQYDILSYPRNLRQDQQDLYNALSEANSK